MKTGISTCRITAVIDSSILSSTSAAELAELLQVPSITAIQGSCQMLKERTGLSLLLGSGVSLINQPVELFTVLTHPESEDAALALITRKFRLDIPGHGTVYSELENHYGELARYQSDATLLSNESVLLQSELMGICCIVQRGKGDAIARVALENGASVPMITYGQGTGLRDKLGLLRITIPADKEIINVVVSTYDADAVMNAMIDAGRLDLPGRGFIHLYPIHKGIINTKVNLSKTRHAASMEQIIGALDEIKNGIQWRSRGAAAGASAKKRTFLSGLMDITLICNEGFGSDCVKAAMAIGAAGATISRCKHLIFSDSTDSGISPARESCSMVVAEKNVTQIINALETAGALSKKASGQILVRPVPKACTYLGK